MLCVRARAGGGAKGKGLAREEPGAYGYAMQANPDALVGHLTALLTALITAWLLSRIRQRPALSFDGRKVIRYPRGITVLGWIIGGFFLVLLVASLLTTEPKARAFCAATFGTGTVVGFSLVLMARRCMISYTDDDVTYSPFFGEPFSFPWRSVETAEYSIVSQMWSLHLSDGRKVRVSPYMDGYKDFLRTAWRLLPFPIPNFL
jgi:hypothetical protein